MSRFYKAILSLAKAPALPVYPYYLVAIFIFSFIFLSPQHGSAQYWTNGQAASFVIGQTGFGLNSPATTATGEYMPASVVEDAATGKVFVSDFNNNRVLRYPSAAAMTNGTAAEVVLGQPDLVSNSISHQPPSSATAFTNPFGLAIDAAGSLWVVDESNNRVLRFDHAATIASGAAANGVLGFPDFVTNVTIEPPTAATMYVPSAVFCKGTTLWVADGGNNRILRFDNAASKANGANADAVFGAPNFVYQGQGVPGIGSYALLSPTQIYVDGADNLWEVEFANNRVMMFPNASTGGNNASTTGFGVEATLVLGQTGFQTNTSGTTASTMSLPYGIVGDAAGNIYVGDFGNNRILVFANAAHLSNGAAASYVLGQTNLTSNGAGDGASQLFSPALLFIPASGASLMAADASNNRVLIYIPMTPLPLLLTGFTGRLQDNGQVLLQWQVSGEGPAGPGAAGSVALEYSTTDSTGFRDVLNTQPVDPAVPHYSYVQVSPAPGVNYYRVRLTVPGGAVSYSPVVSITVGGGASGLGLYPNPAQSSVTVTLPGALPGGITVIEIYNSGGMLVQRLVTGAAVSTMDVHALVAGEYLVKAVQGSNNLTGSFIKVY